MHMNDISSPNALAELAPTHKIFNNHRRSARAGVHIRNHVQYTHDDSSRVSSDILDP